MDGSSGSLKDLEVPERMSDGILVKDTPPISMHFVNCVYHGRRVNRLATGWTAERLEFESR
jgi:hypothetical protein